MIATTACSLTVNAMSPEARLSHTSAFAAGLLDPTCPPPVLLSGPRGQDLANRYDVYRNNVTVSLIDALAAVFPAVQRITGTEFFRAMARFHVRENPPRSPLLFTYGDDFPDFIQRYEYARSMPWLADVARIERAWLDAYHAADIRPLAAEALARVPHDRISTLRFEAHPASRIVRSEFSAVSIFAANRDQAQQDRLDASLPEDGLITRPDFEVEVRHLPPGGAQFLLSLMSGKTLGEAATDAQNDTRSFDLVANLAGMLDAGVFASMKLGEQQ